MSSEKEDEEYDFEFGKPVDDDYIDVECRRADISESSEDEEEPVVSRTRQSADHSTEEYVDVSHILHSGDGSGAASEIEELIDANAIVENDGRSDTRTFFYPSEADDARQGDYARMLEYQEGQYSKTESRDARNRKADQERYVDTFCGKLEASTRVRERTKYVIDGLDMSHMAYFNSQKIVIATISLVANEDRWFIRHDEDFLQLLREINMSLGQLKTARQLVQRKSERL